MKVKVDFLTTTQIDQRIINNVKRYYYTVAEYKDLLLVTQRLPYQALRGQIVIAMFSNPDSTIACDVLPQSPAHWRNIKLTQCTLKPVRELREGLTLPLSKVLHQKITKQK